jgi:peptidoglycan hydrolase CwlO-like protein
MFLGFSFDRAGRADARLLVALIFLWAVLGTAAAQGSKIDDLEDLLRSIQHTSIQIDALQKVLRSPEAAGREDNLKGQIVTLSQRLKDLEASFEKVATDVEWIDEKKAEQAEKEGLDFRKELRELLGPVMREVKQMTAKPREIERLRAQMENLDAQIEEVTRALENLLALLPKAGSPQLTQKLNATIRAWQNRQQELKTQRSIVSQKLEQLVGQKKTFWQSINDLAKVMFKSRGKNLAIAVLAFAFVWVLLHYLHRVLRKVTPFYKEGRSVYVRVFDVMYLAFTAVFSVLTLLGVLYLFGDWVLLSLAIIFVLGFCWAAKQALPRYWNQAILMLNIGPVREGEVVVHNGIPYEVKSINVYTELVNSYLEGGIIRLHIKDLVDLRSRPKWENEQWFPSKKGDWVRLSDRTYGQVIAQTPEAVRLRRIGGAVITYKTDDYLGQSPLNLSQGYRLNVTFGLDYGHQAIITKEIPTIMAKAVRAGLEAEGFGESISSIKVEFKEAGASSLDLAVLADFNGKADSRYDYLKRAIQRLCVDACNANNWVIPFTQVTVHMAHGNA